MAEKYEILKTAPFDARFPNQNQARNCFQVSLRIEDASSCDLKER